MSSVLFHIGPAPKNAVTTAAATTTTTHDEANIPLIATITLNRPKRGNALTESMAREILAALDQCERNPRVRLLVLTGVGKYFCTGMDMKAATDDATGGGGSTGSRSKSP